MSNDKQERIVCAAIKRIGKDFLERDLECIDLCLQFDDEHSAVNCNSLRDIGTEFHSEIQGFITNKNRFVNPKEAMGIAIGAGQILYLNELLDAYINDVIGSRVISPQARMILNAWEHQRKMAECRELKPEDLY